MLDKQEPQGGEIVRKNPGGGLGRAKSERQESERTAKGGQEGER